MLSFVTFFLFGVLTDIFSFQKNIFYFYFAPKIAEDSHFATSRFAEISQNMPFFRKNAIFINFFTKMPFFRFFI